MKVRRDCLGNQRKFSHGIVREVDDFPLRESGKDKVWNRRDDDRSHLHFIDCTWVQKFIESRVNKPWNDTYSIICRKYDKRSKVGHKIIESVWWHVDRNEITYRWHSRSLFIDDEGILREAEPSWTRTKVVKKKQYRRVGKKVFARFENAAGKIYWYQLLFEKIPDKVKVVRRDWDHVTKEYVDRIYYERPAYRDILFGRYNERELLGAWKAFVYAKTKRQLSAEEFEKYIGNSTEDYEYVRHNTLRYS